MSNIGEPNHQTKTSNPLAVEVPEFVPTREELIQVAGYWAQEELQMRLFQFVTGQVGASDWKVTVYANLRIGRIIDAIGADLVNGAVKQVYREAEERDQFLWEVFTRGDQTEWGMVLDVNDRMLDKSGPKVGEADRQGASDVGVRARVQGPTGPPSD